MQNDGSRTAGTSCTGLRSFTYVWEENRRTGRPDWHRYLSAILMLDALSGTQTKLEYSASEEQHAEHNTGQGELRVCYP